MGRKKKKIGKIVENNTIIHMGEKVLVDLDGTKSTYQVYSFQKNSYKCIFTDKFPSGTSFTDEKDNIFVIYPEAELGKYSVIENMVKVEKEKKPKKNPHILTAKMSKSTKKKNKIVIIPKVHTGKKIKAIIEKKESKINPSVNIYCSCIITTEGKEIRINFIDGGQLTLDESSQQYIDVSSDVGRILLASIAKDIKIIRVGDKKYKIKKYARNDAVFVDKYKDYDISKYVVQEEHIVDEMVIIYVYNSLNNACYKNDHDVEVVTLVSKDVVTEKKVKVNAYYCRDCKRYFIDYDAVKEWMKSKIAPAIRISVENVTLVDLNPISQLMIYGYTVKKGVLTEKERHNVLKRVIDQGLMTRQEIIVNIQSKIDFNGKKAGNNEAKRKWEKDIDFVHHYISNSNRTIHGTLIKK